jgi:hypothetical protein
MPSINTVLAGCNFRPAEARERCKQLGIGEQVELEADPDNEYDGNAVKVLADGVFIGFVARADNGPVFAALNRDEEVRAEVVGFQSSIKPILEIELP